MEAITAAMIEHIGAPEASVRVWINEFTNTDFMAGGELLADKQRRLANQQNSPTLPTNGGASQ